MIKKKTPAYIKAQKKWRNKNRERLNEARRKYYYKHRDEIIIKKKLYQQKHKYRLSMEATNRRTKRRTAVAALIEQTKIEMGGKCQFCGYDKDIRALIFHHPDPTNKKYTIGHLRSSASISLIKEEVKKCILICANCHTILEHEEEKN